MAESEKWEFMHDNEEKYQDVICWGVENNSYLRIAKEKPQEFFFSGLATKVLPLFCGFSKK